MGGGGGPPPPPPYYLSSYWVCPPAPWYPPPPPSPVYNPSCYSAPYLDNMSCGGVSGPAQAYYVPPPPYYPPPPCYGVTCQCPYVPPYVPPYCPWLWWGWYGDGYRELEGSDNQEKPGNRRRLSRRRRTFREQAEIAASSEEAPAEHVDTAHRRLAVVDTAPVVELQSQSITMDMSSGSSDVMVSYADADMQAAAAGEAMTQEGMSEGAARNLACWYVPYPYWWWWQAWAWTWYGGWYGDGYRELEGAERSLASRKIGRRKGGRKADSETLPSAETDASAESTGRRTRRGKIGRALLKELSTADSLDAEAAAVALASVEDSNEATDRKLYGWYCDPYYPPPPPICWYCASPPTYWDCPIPYFPPWWYWWAWWGGDGYRELEEGTTTSRRASGRNRRRSKRSDILARAAAPDAPAADAAAPVAEASVPEPDAAHAPVTIRRLSSRRRFGDRAKTVQPDESMTSAVANALLPTIDEPVRELASSNVTVAAELGRELQNYHSTYCECNDGYFNTPQWPSCGWGGWNAWGAVSGCRSCASIWPGDPAGATCTLSGGSAKCFCDKPGFIGVTFTASCSRTGTGAWVFGGSCAKCSAAPTYAGATASQVTGAGTSSIRYTCDQGGYYGAGGTLTCSTSTAGAWVGTVVCNPCGSTSIPNQDTASVTIANNANGVGGAVATLPCMTGFYSPSTSHITRTCSTANNGWGPASGTCTACAVPTTPSGANYLSGSTQYANGNPVSVVHECLNGYYNSRNWAATYTATCSNRWVTTGDPWSARIACTGCADPGNPSRTTRITTSSPNGGLYQITRACVAGWYNNINKADTYTSTCNNAHGKWTESLKCSRCVLPSVPSSLVVKIDTWGTESTPATIRWQCSASGAGFPDPKTNAVSYQTCQRSDGSWVGDRPTCTTCKSSGSKRRCTSLLRCRSPCKFGPVTTIVSPPSDMTAIQSQQTWFTTTVQVYDAVFNGF